jgi:hypothetical protein
MAEDVVGLSREIDVRPAIPRWDDESAGVEIGVPDYGVVEAQDGCDGGIAGVHVRSGVE